MMKFRDVVLKKEVSVILIVLLFFIATSCNNQPHLYNFELQTIDSVDFPLNKLSSNKASVFIFLSPECPMCQNYTLTLNNLYVKYKPFKVGFYGIIQPGKFDKKQIHDFTWTYNVNFNLLVDTDKQLLTYLRAKVTPEVFVVDSLEHILYKGSIDNWLVEPGQKRTVITEHYLDDMLEAIVSNEEIKVKSTEAKGCLIE